MSPILITHNGETHSLTQWAKRIGCSLTMLQRRYRKGLAPADILNPRRIPVSERNLTAGRKDLITYTVDGVTGTIPELCKHFGFDTKKIRARINRLHWSVAEAFERVPHLHKSFRYVTSNGKLIPRHELAKEIGVSSATVRNRLTKLQVGEITPEQFKSKTPLNLVYQNKPVFILNGIRMSARKACLEQGIPLNRYYRRLWKGISPDEAMFKPKETSEEQSDRTRRMCRIRELKRAGLII